MKIKSITIEIEHESDVNELLAYMKGIKPTGGYDETLTVPQLVRASVSTPDKPMPDRSESKSVMPPVQTVPMVPPRADRGRPPITQDWLISRAGRIHNVRDLMKFNAKYKGFANRNGLTPWFAQLCDERMAAIRDASYPQSEQGPAEILNDQVDLKDEAQVRQDVIDQIKAIKGADFSVLDLFIDPATGRIPYTDEAAIPTDMLVDKLDEILMVAGADPDPNPEDDE